MNIKNESFADECLERVKTVEVHGNKWYLDRCLKDIPLLAKRLNKACGYLRKMGAKVLAEELEAPEKHEDKLK